MQLTNQFLNDLEKKGVITIEESGIFIEMLDHFWSLVTSQKAYTKTVDSFCKGQTEEGLFLIDYFMQFLKDCDAPLEKPIKDNLDRIAGKIYKRPIIPRDYDLRIAQSPLQFQIDTYYEPTRLDYKRRNEIVLKALEPQVGEKILDVGCAVGTFVYHSAKAGAQAWGVDYSKKAIETARLLCQQFNIVTAEFIVTDAACKLPFEDGFFDKIVAADYIEHITQAQKESSLQEMSRVLKTGGRMVIFTPNGVRESIGFIARKGKRLIKEDILETRLHFGLTNRFQFEQLLRKYNFEFRCSYHDIGRPYLERIPILKKWLCLNILWVIKKMA